MKSHDKIWGDPITKTSAYAGGISSANKVFFYTVFQEMVLRKGSEYFSSAIQAQVLKI